MSPETFINNTSLLPGAIQGLVIATANLNVDNSIEVARKDHLKVAGQVHPDLFGMQEFREKRRDFFKDNALRGYSFMQYEGEGADRDPISWRSHRFDLVVSKSLMLSKQFYFTTKGFKILGTWGTLVVLRDNWSGRLIHHINTHTPAAVQAGGKFGTLKNRNKNMVETCIEINRYVVSSVGPEDIVVVTGDFNWDAAVDIPDSPEAILAKTGLVSNFTALGTSRGKEIGTHGTRDIDYIFVNAKKGGHVDFVKDGIITGLASDHNASWALLKVRTL